MSGPEDRASAPADVEILVARQPLFDLEGRMAGYELLYRSHRDATGAGGAAPERMSAEVLAGALADMGVERITEGRTAWVNFPRAPLVEGTWKLFDPGSVVLEVLETVDADREVLRACASAREAGYRLALDDFVYDAVRAPLLEFADTVKVDVLGLTEPQLRETARTLAPFRKALVAERVEDDAMRKACAGLGFTLFQGYFFARPETVSRRHLSVEQGNVLRLMNLLRDETVTAGAIEEAFGSDPSLSFKLLRLVNSAHFGGRDIHSIRHAVQLAGRDTLARWLGVLFVSSLARKGAAEGELVHMAVFRARLLELLGASVGRTAETGPLFMVGLFSTLEPLLGTPMHEILDRIAVVPGVRAALEERRGEYADYLELAEAFERGEWRQVDTRSGALGLDNGDVARLYRDSLLWASEHLRMVRSG